jgi:addiction module RelE/StbE family toxin
MQISFSRNFAKQYKKASGKIQRNFDKKLKIFIKNPFESRLKNHSLKGILKDYRSINVTGDWRAIYSQPKKNLVIFEALGTHSQLYK